MNAERTLLSRVSQGQKILVVELPDNSAFDFARKNDPGAVVRSITRITTVPSGFSGKTYEVHITGGRKNIGRGGTTHVYTPVEQAPQMELDLESGTRRVEVDPDGTMRVLDWTGGDETLTTPKGRVVHITDTGVLTLVHDFPEDEPATPELTVENAATADKCGTCKGFGVVRKKGSHAGKPYRTANGAAAATSNGNSEQCPGCHGAMLIARTA